MSYNKEACVNKLKDFLIQITGRLSFNDVENAFKKDLDKNPIFRELKNSGALGKNIIVLLGGRGCGKTLAIRYIKHYVTINEWDFRYISGPSLKGENSSLLTTIIDDVKKKVEEDPHYKVTIAIDDVVEADEISREYLRDDLIPLVHAYAGRVKLVLAAQTERTTAEGVATIQLLKVVLGQAPHSEMFFGEHPVEMIEKSFKNSYIERAPVILFRGAAMVNLDAFWSSLRSVENVEKLADVIVEIFDFYISNIDSNCSKLAEEIKKYKHGIALLALSSLPKIAHPEEKIVIEYKGPVHQELDEPISALNGLGIAELFLKFLSEDKIKDLVADLDKIYNYIKNKVVENLSTDHIKKVLLRAADILPYADVIWEGPIAVLGLSLPEEKTGKGRRKYGPKIDVIHIKRIKPSTMAEEHSFIIIHNLRTEKKRGYISTSSMNKLKKLVDLGIPSEAELRYLAVLIPSNKHIRSVYRCVPITRIGRDVLVLVGETLSKTDKSLISLLYTDVINTMEGTTSSGLSKDVVKTLYKIFIGTVLFNLRDHTGVPQLVYHLLPTIH